MNTKVMFSSETDLWSTPQKVFDELDGEFGFLLDVCATDENAKCDIYFTKEDDGLSKDWMDTVYEYTKKPAFGGRPSNEYLEWCWMNPPYGREIGKWVKKASEEGHTVCLLPARTDTKWFHDHIYGIAEIRFIKGRLKFGDGKGSAPFPSMICIFR